MTSERDQRQDVTAGNRIRNQVGEIWKDESAATPLNIIVLTLATFAVIGVIRFMG